MKIMNVEAVCQSNFKAPGSNTTAFGEITYTKVKIKAEKPEIGMLVQCLATADQCPFFNSLQCNREAVITRINMEGTPQFKIKPRKLF